MTGENAHNILITGRPGVGKTTLVVALSRELSPARPTGFFTREIREREKRRGFALESLDGERMTLAHTEFAHGPGVGKYRVDLPGFDAFLARLEPEMRKAGLLVIDEIGKMECLSPKFERLAKWALDAPAPLIATVAAKGGGLIAEVKRRGDVRLSEVTEQNRDHLREELEGSLASLLQ